MAFRLANLPASLVSRWAYLCRPAPLAAPAEPLAAPAEAALRGRVAGEPLFTLASYIDLSRCCNLRLAPIIIIITGGVHFAKKGTTFLTKQSK